jgi:hypothetical protein
MQLSHPLVAGFCVGAAILPVVYVAAPVSRGDDPPGADVRLTAAPTGEVGMTRGPIVDRRGLEPGQQAGGEREVRNQTGQVLVVSVRAAPGGRELDRLLRVQLRVDGLPLFSGTLGQLRAPTKRWFQLKPGERRRLQVQVQVDGHGDEAWRGRAEDVRLELLPRRRHD